MVSAAASADHFPDNLRISGFGSIALTKGGDDDFGFRSNVSQEGEFGNWSFRPDSVLGVQVDATFSDSLKGTLQLVGKDRPENGLEESVEAAYLSYNIDPRWTLRAGRLGLDLLPMSEYENIGFAYDWVRPPVDYYGLIPFSYLDGVDLRYSRPAGPGTLSAKLYAGKTKNVFESFYQHNFFELQPFYGASLRYELNNFALTASYARSKIQDFSNPNVDLLKGYLLSLPPITGGRDVVETLRLDGVQTEYYSLAAEYRTGPWKATAEIAYLDSEGELFLPFLGGYAGLSRRFGDVSLFGLVSHARTTEDAAKLDAPLLPQPLGHYIQRALNSVQSDQKTFSLGARWDLRSNMALKMQWDRTWVEEGEAFLWGRETEQTPSAKLDTFTLSMDFVF
ncbi:hypothetical protein [Marinobacterium lutimaris]|uniref:Porin n=1 Tax=Marinobacterium lutimaris TaxID=568106 RepID=A0A1H5YY30_9GAMM|nr:hypothetical protein [Marinobacterium lutimaris]SEG28357.1 hypothetical protein SAMN05444390_1011920 [Marinobacterium lutimaris]